VLSYATLSRSATGGGRGAVGRRHDPVCGWRHHRTLPSQHGRGPGGRDGGAAGEAGETGETGEHSEAEATEGEANTATEGADEHGAGESGEELFGINPESAGLTAAVAAMSLLLAVLLVARPGKALLVAVIVVGLAFAVLDVREGIHQANESKAGLLVIALVTGLLHLGVAVAAVAGLRAPRAVAPTA
jgi:hypothetical protein